MKKQLLFLVMMLLPMIAHADKNGTCGENLTWTLNESTGTLTIEGSGAMEDYGRSGYPWYGYREKISTVVIGDGVTNIGSFAFYKCSGLSTVTIPNSVTSIGNSAFYMCSRLTNTIIPNGVTSIGEDAFCDCTGLVSVTIGNSLKSIGNGAFEGCEGLQKVIVSDIASWCGIKFGGIGNAYTTANPLSYAQHLYSDKNTEIKDLVIPNSVTSIGYIAFYSCSGLTSVTIPNSVTSIGEYNQEIKGKTNVEIIPVSA